MNRHGHRALGAALPAADVLLQGSADARFIRLGVQAQPRVQRTPLRPQQALHVGGLMLPQLHPAGTERVEQRLRSHQEEVVRLRAQIGNPQAALFRFVLERFAVQALVPDDRRGEVPSRTLWEDDDELDSR